MGDDTPRISDAEWDVMEVVWDLGAATPAEIIDKIASARGWNHRTVRTLLSRLVEKGALLREASGTRPAYRAAVTRGRCVREESRSFLKKMFNGDVTSLLVHFARDAKVSPDEIEQLKRLLAKRSDGGES